MLLAYERIGSAWAATAVMLADLIPSMLLGPLLGGLVDRTSRLGCAIASDVLRASVFAALMFCGDIAPMLALALLSGVGNALFRPATAALLPSLVSAGEPDRGQRALRDGPRPRACCSGRPARRGSYCSPGPSWCSAPTPSPSRSPPACCCASAVISGRSPPSPPRAGVPAGARGHRDRRPRSAGPDADVLLRLRRPRGRHDERRRARTRPGGARLRPRRLRPARQLLRLRADRRLAARRPRRRRRGGPAPPLPRRDGADGGRA